MVDNSLCDVDVKEVKLKLSFRFDGAINDIFGMRRENVKRDIAKAKIGGPKANKNQES